MHCSVFNDRTSIFEKEERGGEVTEGVSGGVTVGVTEGVSGSALQCLQ